MSKMYNLTLNEFLRNIRRTSTFVIIIIMAVAVFGFGGIVKYAVNNLARFNRDNTVTVTESDNKAAMTQQLDYLQDKIKNAADVNDKAVAQAKYDVINAAFQKGIYITDPNLPCDTNVSNPVTYQEFAVINAINNKTAALIPGDQSAELNSIADRYLNSALNNDFAGFISADNDNFILNSGLPESSDINRAYIYVNSLRQQYNVTGLNQPGSGTKNDLVTDIYNNKLGIIQGINPSTSAVLTDTDVTDANNNIKIDLYKLDKNIVTSQDANIQTNTLNNTIPPILLDLGITVVAILMAILAGSTIAQEIATGSIKALIIAPVKRWKIFLSKFLSIAVLAILLDLLVYVITAVTIMVFYGNGLESYYTVIGGSVTAIPFFSYMFLMTLLKIPQLIIYIILAIMLSAVTRNTAISISIAVAFSLIGSVVVNILSIFFKGQWLTFMPFQHFDLSSKIFTKPAINFGMRINMGGASSSIPVTSLTFSIIYLCVIFILMYLTAHESFTKRDI